MSNTHADVSIQSLKSTHLALGEKNLRFFLIVLHDAALLLKNSTDRAASDERVCAKEGVGEGPDQTGKLKKCGYELVRTQLPVLLLRRSR